MLSVILVYLASGQSSNQGTVAAIEAQIEALREQHAQDLEALLESSYTSEGLTTQASAKPIGERPMPSGDDKSVIKESKYGKGHYQVSIAANEAGTTRSHQTDVFFDPSAIAKLKPEHPAGLTFKGESNFEDAQDSFGTWLNQNGVTRSTKNVYMVIGSATSGFDTTDSKEMHESLKAWCDSNDARAALNGEGRWIVVSQGDGAYDVPSIVDLFEVIHRPKGEGGCGAKIVVIQSDYAFNYGIPFYCDAAFFGPGTTGCYGGWCNEAKTKLGFPDEAMFGSKHGGPLLPDGLRLVDVLGGVFVAGGGAITRKQEHLYGLQYSGKYGNVLGAPLREGDRTIVIGPTPFDPLTEALGKEDPKQAVLDLIPTHKEAESQLIALADNLRNADKMELVLKKLSKKDGKAKLAAWNEGYQAVFR